MGLAVVHIEVNRNRVDYIHHPSDVIGMRMRGYQEIDLVYAQSSQGSNWTVPTRVYERTLAFRRPNEDGVCLPHVVERDPD